jgi:hypothetical protein
LVVNVQHNRFSFGCSGDRECRDRRRRDAPHSAAGPPNIRSQLNRLQENSTDRSGTGRITPADACAPETRARQHRRSETSVAGHSTGFARECASAAQKKNGTPEEVPST